MEDLLEITDHLERRLGRLSFGPPVTHVYDPLEYARRGYDAYLRKYAGRPKEVVQMGNSELSPALRNLAKWCAVLSIIAVIYPVIFLVPDAGYPFEAISDAAQSTAHTHLAGNTLLFFMVGFLFSYTSFDRAKKLWPTIGGITLIIALLGLFFGLLPLIIVGYSIYAISMLVMSVGIIFRT